VRGAGATWQPCATDLSPFARNYVGPVHSVTIAFTVDEVPFDVRFTVAQLPAEGPPILQTFQVRLLATNGRPVGSESDRTGLGALVLSESDADALRSPAPGRPSRLADRALAALREDTRDAVIAYQRDNGLYADGIVDEITRQSMFH
jgi:hypothetical protein